ncbi:MAG: 50S ribosomal protein L9 [Gemmataceae bacterium]
MAKATKTKKADAKAAGGGTKLKAPPKKVRQRQQVKKGAHGGTLIVLIEDVAHLGKQGDLVEVKPGYARNYLLPNSLAVIPTAHNLKLLEKYKIKVQKAREARIADLKVLSEQLSRLTSLTLEANANEEGHLYGSIGPAEISKTLKGKNLMVEPDMVKLDHVIKEANTLTEVPLNLGYGIESKIQVLVVGLQQAVAKK